MNLFNLDHIAMACTDLGAARAELEAKLGVPLMPRGEHPHMGTHNHLLSLGPELYFELIAIDPEAQAPGRPRWFNLDAFEGETRMTNWILSTHDLDKALEVAPEGSGVPMSLERGEFRWQMVVPESGLLPFGGWAPAIIKWRGDLHPAPLLEDHGFRLQSMTLHHPQADEIAAIFAPNLPRDTVLFVASETPSLEVLLATPQGSVRLI